MVTCLPCFVSGEGRVGEEEQDEEKKNNVCVALLAYYSQQQRSRPVLISISILAETKRLVTNLIVSKLKSQ